MTSGGRSPFERLKNHFDESDLNCPDCGYFDEEGAWESRTDGTVVVYSHECPSCGSIQHRTVDIE